MSAVTRRVRDANRHRATRPHASARDAETRERLDAIETTSVRRARAIAGASARRDA